MSEKSCQWIEKYCSTNKNSVYNVESHCCPCWKVTVASVLIKCTRWVHFPWGGLPVKRGCVWEERAEAVSQNWALFTWTTCFLGTPTSSWWVPGSEQIVCVFVCVCVCTCVFVYADLCVHACVACTHVCRRVYFVGLPVWVCAWVCAWVCVCVHALGLASVWWWCVDRRREESSLDMLAFNSEPLLQLQS